MKQLAEAENAGGSDKILSRIEGMDASEIKRYLKQLIKESVVVGIGILNHEVSKTKCRLIW